MSQPREHPDVDRGEGDSGGDDREGLRAHSSTITRAVVALRPHHALEGGITDPILPTAPVSAPIRPASSRALVPRARRSTRVSWFVSPSSRPDFFATYERAFRADLARICAAIPHDDLAIQWDVCQEVLAWEGYFPNRPESYKEDITGMLARLGNAVPEPVELGYHLCYGTPNDEHVVMPTDLANTVEITHGILAGLERRLQYVHVPAPKHRDDDAYYAPLAALRLPEGCDLYLGVIHHDDRDVDRRRIAAAARTVSNFGIATECGWGRSNPARAPGLLDSHRIALEGE